MTVQALSEPATAPPTPRADQPTHRILEPLRRLSPLVFLCQILILGAILLAWQLSADTKLVDPLFVSKPSSIAASLWDGLSNTTLLHLLQTTLYETVVGFVIASLLGIVSGLALYQWPFLNRVLRPFLTAFNNTPRIALAPVLVLWFGLGPDSRIVLVITLVYFIVTFNTYAGLQGADRDVLQLAKALGAKRLVRFRYFILPGAVPSMFTGLQLGLTYAFLGAVVGEMLSGSGGLGAYMSTTSADFKTADFFAALVWLVVVATATSALMRLLELRLLRWRRAELRGFGDGH